MYRTPPVQFSAIKALIRSDEKPGLFEDAEARLQAIHAAREKVTLGEVVNPEDLGNFLKSVTGREPDRTELLRFGQDAGLILQQGVLVLRPGFVPQAPRAPLTDEELMLAMAARRRAAGPRPRYAPGYGPGDSEGGSSGALAAGRTVPRLATTSSKTAPSSPGSNINARPARPSVATQPPVPAKPKGDRPQPEPPLRPTAPFFPSGVPEQSPPVVEARAKGLGDGMSPGEILSPDEPTGLPDLQQQPEPAPIATKVEAEGQANADSDVAQASLLQEIASVPLPQDADAIVPFVSPGLDPVVSHVAKVAEPTVGVGKADLTQAPKGGYSKYLTPEQHEQALAMIQQRLARMLQYDILLTRDMIIDFMRVTRGDTSWPKDAETEPFLKFLRAHQVAPASRFIFFPRTTLFEHWVDELDFMLDIKQKSDRQPLTKAVFSQVLVAKNNGQPVKKYYVDKLVSKYNLAFSD